MDNAHQIQSLALSGGENAAASLVQHAPVQQESLVNHQGTNQLSGFVKPKVVFQRTDHKAKAACISGDKGSYRKDYLKSILDTDVRNQFAKDLISNDGKNDTAVKNLNALRLQIAQIEGAWTQMGSQSRPSEVSMGLLHAAFQGQQQLGEFTAKMIHPTAKMDSVTKFMADFNSLNDLTQDLMKASLAHMQILYERSLIIQDAKNYAIEEDKTRHAGINMLEQSVANGGMMSLMQ